MQPIGQWLGTYILCEAKEKLILIDQHAAHERIGFEKLMLEYEKNGLHCEPLLLPETFDLKPSDTAIFQNYLEELLRFGFEIEFFGGHTFVVKGLPTLLRGKIDIKHLVSDLIEDIKETGEMVSLKDKLHHVLATMACHAQIRANHHLTLDEMSALLKELEHYQFTDFCPHGRPVSVEVTHEEVEKWFRRVL
jgi:DNA mismatch repair protein MutL